MKNAFEPDLTILSPLVPDPFIIRARLFAIGPDDATAGADTRRRTIANVRFRSPRRVCFAFFTAFGIGLVVAYRSSVTFDTAYIALFLKSRDELILVASFCCFFCISRACSTLGGMCNCKLTLLARHARFCFRTVLHSRWVRQKQRTIGHGMTQHSQFYRRFFSW